MKIKTLPLVLLLFFIVAMAKAQEDPPKTNTIKLNLNEKKPSNEIKLITPKEEESNVISLSIDKNAPEISIISPPMKRGFKPKVTTKIVEIKGKVTDESKITSVTVNGTDVQLDEAGIFIIPLELNLGENVVKISATDIHKNWIEEEFEIVQEEKKAIAETPANEADQIEVEGKYYALIIGIDKYPDPDITDLDKPINDAETLHNVLVNKYTFAEEDVKFIKNATRSDIIDALDHFSKTITKADNFLIFYAGHGWWDDKSKIGYWLPSNARKNSKADWFRNSTLRDYLKEVNSKHTLLITDACFGGGIFKTRSAFSDAPSAIKMLYDLPSRKAMTSGTLTEVPDESAFIKYLVQRLEQNPNKFLSSEQLFSSFRIAVINNSEVVPQYGEIKSVGDEGGDFIFIKK